MPRYAAVDIGSNSVRMEAAEVIDGPVAVTVKVKDWSAVFELMSVAVMVIG